eukprot:14528775-Alexandrium_andersonii.AAC.1
MASAGVQSAASCSITCTTTIRAANPPALSIWVAACRKPPAALPAAMTRMVGASASCAASQASS